MLKKTSILWLLSIIAILPFGLAACGDDDDDSDAGAADAATEGEGSTEAKLLKLGQYCSVDDECETGLCSWASENTRGGVYSLGEPVCVNPCAYRTDCNDAQICVWGHCVETPSKYLCCRCLLNYETDHGMSSLYASTQECAQALKDGSIYFATSAYDACGHGVAGQPCEILKGDD